MKRLLLFLLIPVLLFVSCAPIHGLEEDIVGKWIDSNGYVIEFKEGNTGFIPGFADAIPDSSFTYTVIDESTIEIDYNGNVYLIEISIEDDKLIWKDDLGEVVYTRKRESE